jgi:hypothetical protein
LKIIKQIWEWDEMIPKQAGFYGKPFKASRGVRQGDILSPMIFNVMEDAVIRETEMQMKLEQQQQQQQQQQHQQQQPTETTAKEQEQEKEEDESDDLFYADDGLFMDEEAERLQLTITTYAETFGRVGLMLNGKKTVVMVMNGGRIREAESQTAYKRRFKKNNKTHRERMLTKTECNLCGARVNKQHIKMHQSRKICRAERAEYKIQQQQEATTTTTDTETESESETESEEEENSEIPEQPNIEEYCVEIKTCRKTACPVPNCPAKIGTSNQMANHFRNKHVENVVTINRKLHPRCPKCGIFQSNSLTEEHQRSKECMKWAQVYANRATFAKKQKEATEAKFQADGKEFMRVEEFKYLGRIVTDDDNDDKAVDANLEKARKKWGQVGKFLRSNDANPKLMATFYKAIVQAVLLYGSESWAISTNKMRELNAFHNRCARVIARMPIQQDSEGTWTCPQTIEVLETAGLLPIQEYIRRRRATVLQYISTTSLYMKCKASKALASDPNQLVWWDQEV